MTRRIPARRPRPTGPVRGLVFGLGVVGAIVATLLLGGTSENVHARDDDDDDRRKRSYSTPIPGWDEDDGPGYDEDERGRDKNIVRLNNRTDDRLRVKGNVQLNHIRGDYVEPVNVAFSYASCVDCQTVAMALQINLYDPDAQTVAPENSAVALNYECTRCRTVALAIQYSYDVDDPDDVPDDARRLIREMDRELRDIHGSERRIPLEEAEARLNAVVAQFQHLALRIDQARDEKVTDGNPSIQAAPTATPTVSPTTATDPAQPEPTPTSTPIPAEATTPTPTPYPTATATETPTTPVS